MKTSATNRKLRLLLTAIKNNSLIPRPEFQRRLVWTTEDKNNFLQSVLKGYPFPEIYIAAGAVNSETGEGSEMLVDGQQRITTLYQYFYGSNELKLKSDIKAYKELGEDEKIDFLEYEVVIRDLGKKSIEEIKEIFKRINSTKYSLNAMEIHNARFDGAFKKYADKFSQKSFFEENKVFSTNEIRRMKDLVFCLTISISILSTYFNRDEELEKFLEKYNDEFSLEYDLDIELNRVIEIINSIKFASRSRVWKKADLLNLFVEIHKAIFKTKLSIDWAIIGNSLIKFYELVDGMDSLDVDIVNYRKTTTAATNDKGSRILRGEIINKIITGQISY